MRTHTLIIAVLLLTPALPCMASGQQPAARPWPSGRAGHALAYDALRGETVLFGGDTDASAQTRDSVWAWSGEEWRVSAAQGPGWLTLPAMAFDSRRGRVVLLGGMRKLTATQYADSAESATWEWDGTRWERREGVGPGPIDHHALAYDEARGVIVLQGGADGRRILGGTTWTFDGDRWTMVADSAAGPGQRVHHAMAYDSRRQRVVLFGGFGESGDPPADTWEWDGQRWHRVAAAGPGARRRHRMAYDAARAVVVLYGGGEDTATWTWDGAQWRLAAHEGPPARGMHAMAYDARRRRVVLYGGGTQRADLWEWDGSQWQEVRR